MATVFTLSTGEKITLESSASSVVPSDQYVAWATEYGFPTTGTDVPMDGDDAVFYVSAPSFIGTGQWFLLCSEGGFELPPRSSSLPTGRADITVPNISRYYTAAGVSVNRFSLSFHPPYDTGTLGVKVRRDAQRLICGGDVTRVSGQVVSFALLIDSQNLFFDLYLSTGAGSPIPIYAQEFAANGYVENSQVLVGTIPVNGKLRIYGGLHQGLLGGYVYDPTGAGVARPVRAYVRSTGELSGETTSSADNGSFVIRTKSTGEHYVVALDDDAAPHFNSLILDRVVPQPPS